MEKVFLNNVTTVFLTESKSNCQGLFCDDDVVAEFTNYSSGVVHQDINSLDLIFLNNSPTTNVLLFRAIIHSFDIYVIPVILMFGIVGNVISFCVFMFTFMRQMSSCVYLSGLCLSDIGFLLCAAASWSDNINLRIYHKPGICQFFVYFTYITSFLSVWYVVAFSLERYLAVKFPFKRQVS